ncbi:hypothetical protein [Spiroplasma endosymbiont of Labia minor]|uniref:hypothetical protein n=1 Tax=Spiroplasma endosymbiont of Labia minor TaxID=3066305 RepID=UPI0030D447A1
MAETKKISQNHSSVIKKQVKSKEVYEPLYFNDATIEIIKAYNLQGEENYKSLMVQFERINLLSDEDTRKVNLIQMWEEEFNRIFKDFWEQNISMSRVRKTNKSQIDGWKDRLNIKEVATNPDDLRKTLIGKLNSVNAFGQKRNNKEDIMKRAGYRNIADNRDFNYQVPGKSGTSAKIESMLDAAETSGVGPLNSMLSNTLEETRDYKNTPGFSFGSGIEGVVNLDGSLYRDETLSDFTFAKQDSTFDEIDGDNIYDDINENDEKQELSDEDIDQLANDKQFNYNESVQGFAAEPSSFDINSPVFGNTMNAMSNGSNPNYMALSMPADTAIDPNKRNILEKNGFHYFDREKDYSRGGYSPFETTEEPSKPYHEIKPVGNYGMTFEYSKRPSMEDLLESEKNKTELIDEMTEKMEFLRDLRNERRHRISLMKIERANSFIVTRSRRLTEIRQQRRQKHVGNDQLKLIERNERIRRLNERQKLIQLMKERQIKKAEERRVASLLRIERERRLQREAKYRNQVSSLDAQIRHEQEVIKRAELKMKTYFTKNWDAKYFDESLKLARQTSKYVVTNSRIKRMQDLEDVKRANRIEKLSRKFIKNQK